MNLYLVRHGEAKKELDDSARPLSARGREEVEMLGAYLSSQGIKVAEIRHSPKARAQQTAEILSHALSASAARVQGLLPEDDAAPIVASLLDETRDLMLVGHMPQLADLAALLLRGAAHPPIALRTAGLLHFQRDGARWRLL